MLGIEIFKHDIFLNGKEHVTRKRPWMNTNICLNNVHRTARKILILIFSHFEARHLVLEPAAELCIFGEVVILRELWYTFIMHHTSFPKVPRMKSRKINNRRSVERETRPWAERENQVYMKSDTRV